MNIAILWAVLLSTTMAGAETIIIEYPDHFYVESAGIAEANPAPSRNNSSSPATASFSADHESPPLVTARPITSSDNSQQPMDPAERRAAMERELERLQRERSMLLAPREGETYDQANHRQQEAASKLRKINRISSELAGISRVDGAPRSYRGRE